MVSVNEHKYRIAIIGDMIAVTGFQIAGISSAYKVSTTEEAEEIVKKLSGDADIGIVIVQESVMSMIKNRRTISIMENSTLPIFVSIPAYGTKLTFTDPLRELIMRVIGIDITNNLNR